MSAAAVNPFPAGSKLLYPDLWADRKDTLSTLRKAFSIAFASSEPMLIQVLGDYGAGKSHTLRHIEHKVLEGEWEKTKGFPIYMESPGTDLLDFFNRFLSATKMETLQSALREMLARIMLSKPKNLQKDMLEGKISADEVVRRMAPTSLREDLTKELVEIFKGTGFSLRDTALSDYWEHLAIALSMLPQGGDEQFAAAKWLTFGKLYKYDKELLKIEEYPSSAGYIAANTVAIIRLISHAANYRKVVLLIDELETVTESRDLAQCIRQLIDSGLPELVIVLGSSTEASEVFGEGALIRRIHMTLKLSELSPSDAKQFVSDYLARSPRGKAKDSLTPFDDASVSVFNAAAKGKVSSLLPILNRAYDMYIREGWKEVGKDQAQKVLSEAEKLGIYQPSSEEELLKT